VLINGGMKPDVFAKVLSEWIMKEADFKDSRNRFFQSFRQANAYNIDRLVATANMFDILPNFLFPEPPPLNEEVKMAIAASKDIFKKIKVQSSHKDYFLGTLGKLQGHSLRTKIKIRADIITDIIGHKLPDLDIVINEAVSCRNFFVHGTYKGTLNQKDIYYFSSFFVDTFEFIFAVSDLIESGWDINEWLSNGSCLTHPFAAYLYSYREVVTKLKKSLSVA